MIHSLDSVSDYFIRNVSTFGERDRARMPILHRMVHFTSVES
jgi:hypothetical protein